MRLKNFAVTLFVCTRVNTPSSQHFRVVNQSLMWVDDVTEIVLKVQTRTLLLWIFDSGILYFQFVKKICYLCSCFQQLKISNIKKNSDFYLELYYILVFYFYNVIFFNCIRQIFQKKKGSFYFSEKLILKVSPKNLLDETV